MNLYVSILHGDDLPGKIQTHADPFYMVNLRFPVKPGENRSLALRRDSLAGIPDTDAGKQFLSFDLYVYMPSGSGILYPIIQEVKKSFPSPFFIMI